MNTTESKLSAEVKRITTFEEFRVAVKYLLMHEHSMPELIAEEFLVADSVFMNTRFSQYGIGIGTMAETAESLVVTSDRGVNWIRLEEGDRQVSGNHAVIEINDQLNNYFEKLLELGLFGKNYDEVALAMVARGIESSFQMITSSWNTKKS